MNSISPGMFINAWKTVYEGNESWMGQDDIIQGVMVELGATEELVKRMIKVWKDGGHNLPGSDN